MSIMEVSRTRRNARRRRFACAWPARATTRRCARCSTTRRVHARRGRHVPAFPPPCAASRCHGWPADDAAGGAEREGVLGVAVLLTRIVPLAGAAHAQGGRGRQPRGARRPARPEDRPAPAGRRRRMGAPAPRRRRSRSWCGDFNRDAQRFYESFGFAVVGRSAGAGGMTAKPVHVRTATPRRLRGAGRACSTSWTSCIARRGRTSSSPSTGRRAHASRSSSGCPKPGSTVLVAERGADVVGLAVLLTRTPSPFAGAVPRKVIELDNIVVRADQRGWRVGRRLLARRRRMVAPARRHACRGGRARVQPRCQALLREFRFRSLDRPAGACSPCRLLG